MSNLREKVIHQAVNQALDKIRAEMAAKYKPKKEGRFFSNGVTYEIAPAKLVPGGVQYEISSKIPQDIFQKKGQSDKFFKDMKKIMTSKDKKPTDVKMENIIRSTMVNEIKERDYVKCSYFFKEEELFGDAEIDKVLKKVQAGKIDLSDIKGPATIAGKAVIYSAMHNMYDFAHHNVSDLVAANNQVIKTF